MKCIDRKTTNYTYTTNYGGSAGGGPINQVLSRTEESWAPCEEHLCPAYSDGVCLKMQRYIRKTTEMGGLTLTKEEMFIHGEGVNSES